MGDAGSSRALHIVGVAVGVAVAAAVMVAAVVWGTGFSLPDEPIASPTAGATASGAHQGDLAPQPEPETVTVTVTVPAPTTSSADVPDPSASSSSATASPSAPATPQAPRLRGLFNGAYTSPYASKKPSMGGVRLATVPDTPKRPLTGKFIVVDPGHNGVADARIHARQVPMGGGKTKACNTSGTQTAGGYPEHAHNWDVAINLAALLRDRGATVILTRPNDKGVGPCVDERAAIGNRARADLVVSVHADGNTARTARGFHIITSTDMAGGAAVTAKSQKVAEVIRDEFAAGTGMPRSTYLGGGQAITPRADIAGLNLSTVPAVMVETGNMRHTGDARLLSSPSYRVKEAHALAAGIQKALGR